MIIQKWFRQSYYYEKWLTQMFLTCGKMRRNVLTSPFLFDDFGEFVDGSMVFFNFYLCFNRFWLEINLKKTFEIPKNLMQWNTKVCQRLTTTNSQLKFVAKIICGNDNESDIGKCDKRTNKETNLNDKIIFECMQLKIRLWLKQMRRNEIRAMGQ